MYIAVWLHILCALLAMHDFISFSFFINICHLYVHCHDMCSPSQHIYNCVPFALFFTDLAWAIMLPTWTALSHDTLHQIYPVLQWACMIHHTALALFNYAPDCVLHWLPVILTFSQCLIYKLHFSLMSSLWLYIYVCMVWLGHVFIYAWSFAPLNMIRLNSAHIYEGIMINLRYPCSFIDDLLMTLIVGYSCRDFI